MQNIQDHFGYIKSVAAVYAHKPSSVQARLTKDDLISLFTETLVKCSKQFKTEKGAGFKTYLNTALHNAYKNALDDSIRQGGISLTDIPRPEGEDNPIEDILFCGAETLFLSHKIPFREPVETENPQKRTGPSLKPKRTTARSEDKPLRIAGMTAQQLAESLVLSDLIDTFYHGGPKMRNKFPEVWKFLKSLKSFKCALCGEDFRDSPMRARKRFPCDDFELKELTEQWGKVPSNGSIFCCGCRNAIWDKARDMNVDFHDFTG
jgi:DNA-directed RNA polymerase specialized sigma24 family protein